jgi:hypothetical protein
MYPENFAQPNKSDYLKIFTDRPVPNSIAVTLTLKQRIEGNNCRGRFGSSIDPIKISDNTRHFLNRLNQKVYGKKFTRFNKCLSVIPVIEGSKDIRWHVHMAIEQPDHLSFEEFEKLIVENWLKTKYGYNDIRIRRTYDYLGWIDYMLKNYSKEKNLSDSVDVCNLHLKKK